MLTAENISVTFPDRQGNRFVALALEWLEAQAGKITAVAGPSGSGKSTLLYVLSGLLPPGEGRVTHAGQNIYAFGEGRRDAWRRRTIGFVFQDFHLIPELSVTANVELPLTFGRGGGRKAGDLLARLGVPVERQSIEDLSRGERQRVAIARALVFDPPVILADEPTASLDDAAAREVRKVFRDLAGEGRAVVVVSHDWAMLGEADTTVHLEHGHLVTPVEIAAE